MRSLILFGALVALMSPLEAQFGRGGPPVQDNSFLVEEAYNQEAGTVHHALLLQHARHGSGWVLGFSQEWPLQGQRHQVGFTLPFIHSETPGIGSASGVGDLLVNYRFQAVGAPGTSIWVAPRATVLVPSGAWQHGRGAGSVGLQFAVPATLELAPTLTAHLNGSLTLWRAARDVVGARASMASVSGGASLVWLPLPGLNFLTEVIVEDAAEVAGPGSVSRRGAVFLAPGVRGAHNMGNGLQIVPGIAYAIGLGHAGSDSALLLYLSVEHRFRR